jgi:hypothetical protein
MADVRGGSAIKGDLVAASTGAWTSGTSVDTVVSIAVAGFSAAIFSLNAPSTMSAGVVTFEGSDDAGTTWYPVAGVRLTGDAAEPSFTLASTTVKLLWRLNAAGLTDIRVRLSTIITGSGTATVRLQASALPPDIMQPLGPQIVRILNGKGTFSNTTAADIIAAQGAGKRIVVTSIVVTNAHATVGTKVEIRDGTTVKLQPYAVAAGGGFALAATLQSPLFIAADNAAVTARCVTTGADVDVFVAGYLIG